jgi:hypothetical protein
LISLLRYGDSEKPPTIKMKFTGAALATAYSMSWLTLLLILSNNGLKKLTITAGGKSTEEAPLYLR